MDEFEQIAELFRPLTRGAPEALGLRDDAAALAARPGFDLILTTDTVVEGVHFLPADPPELVGRKLLRVNLSDLAAKAAEPFAYLLNVAWSPAWGDGDRRRFADGLGADQDLFGVRLIGGDTVSTPGPITLSATLLGWCPAGAMVRRSGAKAGDVLLVSGSIGDGGLGLDAARGGRERFGDDHRTYLAGRYRLPEPRLALRSALRTHARAAADVSDGLLADAGHIGDASGAGVEVWLDRLPLSPAARAWLDLQPDAAAGRIRLATAGDDYEVVCAAGEDAVEDLQAAGSEAGVPLHVVGRVTAEPGVRASFEGAPYAPAALGWRHS